MMKRMMLAVVAAMVVCFAQAVTCKWDDWKALETSGGSIGTDNYAWLNGTKIPSFTDSSSFAIKVTLSLSSSFTWKADADGTGMLLMLVADATSTTPQNYAFQVRGSAEANSIYMDEWTPTGKEAVNSGISLQAGAAYTFTFAYDNEVLSTYVNGQKVADYEMPAANWGKITEIDVGIQSGGDHKLQTLAQGFTFSDFAYSTTMLPEPTALALLALGVAGVALRRRVA